jgi:hypothetical protein
MRRAITPTTGMRRLVAVLALSSVVALAAAALNTGAIGLLPPRVGSPELDVAAATTHVFIDTPAPSVAHRREYPVTSLIRRAELLGHVLTTPPVLERVARRAKIAPDRIAAAARTTANVPLALTEPPSEQRASDIAQSGRPYRIEVQARFTTPIVDIYTQAPSVAEAERLGNAAVAGLEEHLLATADERGLEPGDRLSLRQLGPARGGVVNGGMPVAIAVVTFVVAFALSCGALLFATRRRRHAAPERHTRPERPPGGDWPRTTRLLPWTFAGFLAVLWLVPFNEIELVVTLPIDLKFDRLVLPFVAAAWGLALLVGGRAGLRFRLTWIHAAVAAFVLCAFLSVVLGARDLNRSLELEGSLKGLPLLISYVSLFLIAASGVRAAEVRPFLTYTLGLAVICALGMIWEYRMVHNPFWDWSAKLLPGIFTMPQFDASAVDDIGRRMVRGPAALPLEAVAMLSMALPIALVWLMQARRWRDRVIYGLAACLLLAAALATYRKSALLAPIAIVATIAYFRRAELLKLAPLALVLVVVVHIVAPGAIGKTGTQFGPGSLGVATVSDRSADYDAVRPDVWTHLFFGRGWGSYDHETYRILDSEILHRLLEMGVLGVLSFVLMIVACIVCARATIAARDPWRSPLALAGAASAAGFLAVSTLFDVLAFPHPTYIFFYMAGLVAVAIQQGEFRPQPRLPSRRPRVERGGPRESRAVERPLARAGR